MPVNYKSLIAALLFLLFSGCSTYRLNDFSSKDKFYEDFNHFANNKSLKVVLKNDSTIFADEGAKILNDSLYIFRTETVAKEIIVKKDEIDTEYTLHRMYYKNKIILKNGEIIDRNKMELLPDSSIRIFHFEDINKVFLQPIDNIKKISYKNHWLGLPFGFISGVLVGAGIGGLGLIPVYETHGNVVQYTILDYPSAIAEGMAGGVVIGSIVGWIIGWNYTYEFNP